MGLKTEPWHATQGAEPISRRVARFDETNPVYAGGLRKEQGHVRLRALNAPACGSVKLKDSCPLPSSDAERRSGPKPHHRKLQPRPGVPAKRARG